MLVILYYTLYVLYAVQDNSSSLNESQASQNVGHPCSRSMFATIKVILNHPIFHTHSHKCFPFHGLLQRIANIIQFLLFSISLISQMPICREHFSNLQNYIKWKCVCRFVLYDTIWFIYIYIFCSIFHQVLSIDVGFQ